MKIEKSDLELIEKYVFEKESLRKEEINIFEKKVIENLEFKAHYLSLNKIANTLLEDHYTTIIDNLIAKKKKTKIWYAAAASIIAIFSISFYFLKTKESKVSEVPFNSIFIPFLDNTKKSFGIASSNTIDSLEILIKIAPLTSNKYLFDDTLRLQFSSNPKNLKLIKNDSNDYWLEINNKKSKINKTLEWTNL
jgi:hypothetical protein